jgi:hypothetical protein
MNIQDVEAARKKRLVLTLVVQSKWFELYLENFKKEDYRAITPYWERRLCNDFPAPDQLRQFKQFDFVDIRDGYTKKRIVFKFDGIRIKSPNKLWAPPEFHDKRLFAIKMGDLCFTENVYSEIDRVLAEKTLDENYF